MIDQRLDAAHDEACMIGKRLDEPPLRRRVAIAYGQRFRLRREVIPRPSRFRIFHARFVKQRLVKGDELELGAGGHTPCAAPQLELFQRAGNEVIGLERRIGVDERFQIADQPLIDRALIASARADDVGACRQSLVGVIGPLGIERPQPQNLIDRDRLDLDARIVLLEGFDQIVVRGHLVFVDGEQDRNLTGIRRGLRHRCRRRRRFRCGRSAATRAQQNR